MNSTRPKVVFDCNVLLQAIAREKGPSAECLRLVERNAISLFLSRPILREVRRILNDAIVRAKNPALNDEIIGAFLRKLIFRGNLVRKVPFAFEFLRDPDDAKYVNVAAAVEAEFLVTRDNDLLDLMSGTSVIGKQFRQRFPRLTVVNPVAFLEESRKRPESFGSSL